MIDFQATGNSSASTNLVANVAVLTDPGGDALPFQTQDGQITIGSSGDVNCDGTTNVVDGMFILQYDVGLRSGSSQCPPPSDSLYEPACDVNGDSNCNVVDGLFVLQCDVGIPNDFCPTANAPEEHQKTNGQLKSLIKETTSAVVSITSGDVGNGDVITTTVSASLSSTLLGAATIDIYYDPAVVNVVDCAIDTANVFDYGYCNPVYENDGVNPDVVRFNVTALSGIDGSVQLAEIAFSGIGQTGESSLLEVDAITVTDPSGNTIPVTTQDGELHIVDTAPTPTPTPTPAPSPTETIYLPIILR